METLIRPARSADHGQLADLLGRRWGGPEIALRGELVNALALPALVAEQGGGICGLLTYRFIADACEIVSLDALRQWRGIGTRLIAAVAGLAVEHGARRLLVVTTNDNLDALRFYQRRGFVCTALRPNAIAASRKLKPAIPLAGCHGIPIRDELELTCVLKAGARHTCQAPKEIRA